MKKVAFILILITASISIKAQTKNDTIQQLYKMYEQQKQVNMDMQRNFMRIKKNLTKHQEVYIGGAIVSMVGAAISIFGATEMDNKIIMAGAGITIIGAGIVIGSHFYIGRAGNEIKVY